MRPQPTFKTITRQVLTSFLLLCTTLFAAYHVQAQITNAPVNTYQPWVTPVFPGMTVTSSPGIIGDAFANKGNVIDGDAGNVNSASWTGLLGGSAWLEVQDANAGAAGYPAGTYAGFVLSGGSLTNLTGNTVMVTTYLAGTLQDTYTASDAALAVSLLSGGNQLKVGLVTTKPFDKVRVTITNGLSIVPTWNIYYAEILRAQAGPIPACNTNTAVVQTAYPAVVSTGTTGIATVNLLSGGIFANVQNVTDNNTANAATITMPAGVVSTAYISVREAGTSAGGVVHPAGYFAGFEVSNPTLLGLGLLNNATVTTYLDGVQQDVVSGNGLLLSTPLLSGNSKSTIGFVTTKSFNEVRLTLNQTVSVNLGTTSVYNAIIKQFCAGILACNTPTRMDASQQPVYIDAQNSGISGAACVSCSVTGLDSVIDGNSATAATINLTAGVIASGSVAVRDAVTTYSAGTYAGFDVQMNSLLNVDVSLLGAGVQIKFYKSGVLQQTSSGAQLLLGAQSSALFGGGSHQTVGAIATVPFDEVQISFNQTATVSLGVIKVYDVIWQKNCVEPLPCTTSILLKAPDYGVVIDAARTGINGLVGAGSYVQDPGNIIDQDPNNFANLNFVAGVASQGSIAVQSGANVFPGGTYAGFLIRDNASPLLLADLLKGITITTYRNGVQVESQTATNLLALTAVIPIISTSGLKEVGFMTGIGKDFDEVQITVNQLVSAALPRSIDVFGAVIDTRYVAPGTPGLNCTPFHTNPDINYTTINKPVTGNVATNDFPSGMTYTNATPVNGADGQPNPAGATITLNADGTYTFTATTAGVYSYSITVTNGATSEQQNLTITVTDPASTTNPPVVNTDIAATNAGTPVTVNVLANDRPGNTGGTLGTPSIAGNPSNGTAVVNGDGTITYTPAAGFVGKDTITYTACETPSGKCGNAYIVVDVKPAAVSATSATDDFNKTLPGTAVTGNVKTNDVDPGGLAQTVTAQDVTTTAGHFVLAADGSYTFTPAAGYTGTAQYTYTTTNTAGATATATLYVAVNALAGTDLTPRITFNPNNIIGANTIEVTVLVSEIANTASAGTITLYIDKLALLSNFSFDPAATVNSSGIPVQNNLFTVDAVTNPNYYIITTTSVLQNAGQRVMFKLSADPKATKGTTTVNVLIQAGAGGDVNPANNSSNTTITYSY